MTGGLGWLVHYSITVLGGLSGNAPVVFCILVMKSMVF